MKLIEFTFKIRVSRLEIELSNQDLGLWVGFWQYTGNGGSAYPRWQWRVLRGKPVTMKREQVPVLEFAGARIVRCQLIEDESSSDTTLDAEVVE